MKNIIDDVLLIRGLTDNIINWLSDDTNLASATISELGVLTSVLSGQRRGPLIEKWIRVKYAATCMSNKQDRGDLIINGKYIELKTCILKPDHLKNGIIFFGNQIRLYQKIDNYIFVSIDPINNLVNMWRIPHNDLYNHYINGDIAFSSSHKANGSRTKHISILDMNAHTEWGITLKSGKYDWNRYKITEDGLKK